jgi:hypothetical protein
MGMFDPDDVASPAPSHPWLPIERAPRDQVIDLWATEAGLMMPFRLMPFRRFTDCWWKSSPQIERALPLGFIAIAFGPSGFYQGNQLLEARYWMPRPPDPPRSI